MEELLSTIPSSAIRDYMRESMNCYMAGAYRGSIVMSYIALFDDVLVKLGELGSVNAAAKSIFVEASKRKADQDVYESYLIDQLTSKSLLSGLDSAFLTTLRTLRNKSAHPSGHRPSPEEARFIFYETVARFLSKPILSTTQLVDEIIARLVNSNFFPVAIAADISTVVGEEISGLHDEALPQLVMKLVAAVVSADANVAKNASLFCVGLALQGQAAANNALQAKLVASKSDDPQYSTLILQVLSADGRLALGLNAASMGRIRAVLLKQVDDLTAAVSESKLTHPAYALNSIASVMPEAEFLSNFQSELTKLIEKRPQSQSLVKLVTGRPLLLEIYFPLLLAKAGSNDFGTANSMANALDTLDGALASLLDDTQAFQLIVAVLKAAECGAFGAQGLRGSNFASVPLLRSKAIAYVTSHESEAGTYLAARVSSAKPISEFVSAQLTDEAEAAA